MDLDVGSAARSYILNTQMDHSRHIQQFYSEDIIAWIQRGYNSVDTTRMQQHGYNKDETTWIQQGCNIMDTTRI